ncbi:hypothetical protein ACI7RC_15105 [Brevibacillus sp. B_LB10_24]|uniref:hypothetical protein n=1 Tax=Brevibacillus sp. B_LB10_24 TaxID=3380645 RepID=UPI0038B8DDF5
MMFSRYICRLLTTCACFVLLLFSFAPVSLLAADSQTSQGSSAEYFPHLNANKAAAFRQKISLKFHWQLKVLAFIALFPLLLANLPITSIHRQFFFIPIALKRLFLMPIKYTTTFLV